MFTLTIFQQCYQRENRQNPRRNWQFSPVDYYSTSAFSHMR